MVSSAGASVGVLEARLREMPNLAYWASIGERKRAVARVSERTIIDIEFLGVFAQKGVMAGWLMIALGRDKLLLNTRSMCSTKVGS